MVTGVIVPRLVFEPSIICEKPKASHIRRFAAQRKRNPTPAERKLDQVLSTVNNGALKGRFVREHIVSGKWIVDFFIPEVRLAIEVDGSIHQQDRQRKHDHMKDEDCARFDITVLRVTNSEVFGDRELLLRKLRQGWRDAKQRPNHIIGKTSPLTK
jgi:very-short-patch-repair endonuclease